MDVTRIAKMKINRKQTAPTKQITIGITALTATIATVKIILPANPSKVSAAMDRAKGAKPAAAASLIAEAARREEECAGMRSAKERNPAAPVRETAGCALRRSSAEMRHATTGRRAGIVRETAGCAGGRSSAGIGCAVPRNPAIPARRIAAPAQRQNAGMRWMMTGMVRSTVQMRIARHSRTTGAGEMILCAAMEHVMERNRARAVRRTAAHVPLNPSAGMISVMEQKPVIRVKEIAGNATTKRDAGME